MTTLTLRPEVEKCVRREAESQGVSLEEYANQVLYQQVLAAEQERRKTIIAIQSEQERRERTIALLQSWIDEDNDSEEGLDDDFFQQLDANRPEGWKLFPPELKGISW